MENMLGRRPKRGRQKLGGRPGFEEDHILPVAHGSVGFSFDFDGKGNRRSIPGKVNRTKGSKLPSLGDYSYIGNVDSRFKALGPGSLIAHINKADKDSRRGKGIWGLR
jgi:hypothetical protein